MAAPEKPTTYTKFWSTTPATNGVTPLVVPYGWPENMAPSAVNNTARQNMTDLRLQLEDAEWFSWGQEVSKVSGTSFKIATDVTAEYLTDRRIKIFDTTTKYATVASSSYSAPDTTITLQFDNSENSLAASFTAVALSILRPTNTAIPRNFSAGNGSKNIIIGGNFSTNPWQRGTTSTSAPTATYLADRFVWVQSGAGVIDYKKTTDAPTVAQAGIYSADCLHIDVTTADAALAAGDQYEVRTAIEGYDFAAIFGRSYTLSFWHKHTKTGIYNVAFYNNGSDQYYIGAYTQDTTDTWEYATIVVPAYSTGTWLFTTGVGLYISFPLAMGSTLGSGVAATWTAATAQLATASQVNAMDSTSNNFKLALIKLEPGAVATGYPVESQSEILARCQRYYYRSTGVAIFGSGYVSTTANAVILINLPVTMRANPTLSNSAAANFTIRYAAATSAATAIATATDGADENNYSINVAPTGTPLTVGDGVMLECTDASSFMAFSADI